VFYEQTLKKGIMSIWCRSC